jgi:hypothetical protein
VCDAGIFLDGTPRKLRVVLFVLKVWQQRLALRVASCTLLTWLFEDRWLHWMEVDCLSLLWSQVWI